MLSTKLWVAHALGVFLKVVGLDTNLLITTDRRAYYLRLLSKPDDYVARVALHRDQIRAETDTLDWLFSTHTTDRSAAELLLFLHSGMMVSKATARTSTVKAGRSA